MAAPKGNTFGAKTNRLLSDALIRQLRSKAAKGPEKADRIAAAIVRAAESGEPWAAALCFDRLEGKARQQVTLTGDDDAPPVSITVVSK